MTAVILAGGQSKRKGTDKMKLDVAGEPLLLRNLRRFQAVFPRVLVSTASADRYPELGDIRVYDEYPGAGPMAGLHAALTAAGEDIFLVGGDMPFADPEKAMTLISLCGDCEACVLTDGDGRWEPLFGYYRYSALEKAEALLEKGQNRMAGLLSALRLREVRLAELGESSDSLLRNLNKPEDYEKLRLELGE